MNKLTIVVPCYNEESVLEETTRQLSHVIEELIDDKILNDQSMILYVNDGSSDDTWSLIEKFHSINKYVCGVKLAKNEGHQKALWAGLSVAADISDITISIDADLQDDLDAIRKMVVKYNEGYDIVYGVRSARKTDSWFKRTTAITFYKLMKYLGAKSVYNHADFRLMSRRALKQLLEYKERNIFLRGLVPLVGYSTTCVYYERKERIAGESKYPLAKMISFAVDGITSFSIKPIHFVFYLGLFFIIVALCTFIYVLHSYYTSHVVAGWSSLMLSIWFCSGCILICLGIIGEYIGKIYIEVKNRPLYNIEKVLLHD